MCCEDISLIRGYERAVNDTTQMYELHHLEGVFYTKEEMKRLGKYYHQPAMALIFLTRSEHKRIHYAFKPMERDRKEKIREARTNCKITSKPVRQYTLDGVFVKEWPSAMEPERELGYNNSNIGQCCLGKRVQANGFLWRYSQDCSDYQIIKPVKYRDTRMGVNQYTSDGIFIRKWESLKDVSRTFGFNVTYIRQCCRGKQKTAYGYIWRYAE